MTKNTIAFFTMLFLLHYTFEVQSQRRLAQRNVIRYTAGQPYTDFYLVYVYPSPYTYFYDETLGYDQDSNAQFYNDYKSIHTRDSLGNEVEKIGMSWDGNQWIFSNKENNDYDIFNNSVKYSFYQWQLGSWYETYRLISVYSTSNLLLESSRMDLVSNVLTNTAKTENAYDILKRRTEQLNYSWINNQWQPTNKTNQYYKGNNNMQLDSTIQFEWNTTTNQYVKNGRILYDYNVAGQLISMLKQNNPTQWNSYDKEEYLNDNNGNVIDKKRFYWDVTINDWTLYENWLNEYDSNNRLVEEVHIQMNNNTNQLENFRRQAYTYAPDSSKVTYQFSNWGNATWDIVYEEETLFELVQQLPSSVENSILKNVVSYPNPFATNTIIEFESQQASVATIQIADYTGRIVLESQQMVLSGKNSFLWNAVDKNGTALTSGMYFLKLNSNNQSFHTKLLKQ